MMIATIFNLVKNMASPFRNLVTRVRSLRIYGCYFENCLLNTIGKRFYLLNQANSFQGADTFNIH